MKPKQLIGEMNEYYARRAPLHDGYMGYRNNETMEDLLGPIIRWFDEYLRDKVVLEVACGTGNWTQVLAKRAQSVVATDVNASVIEIARTKPYPKSNVVLRVADAYDLGGLCGQFDAAFAADWWSHIPKAWIRPFLDGLLAKL
jgi:ubiquinone/menaquinone biosynthesis C-methylase UbiE